MVDPVLYVFQSHVLYSSDLKFLSSAIPYSSGFVDGVFRESGVVQSFEVVDPVSRLVFQRSLVLVVRDPFFPGVCR